MLEKSLIDITKYLAQSDDLDAEFRIRLQKIASLIQNNESYDEQIKSIAYPKPMSDMGLPKSQTNDIKGVDDLILSLQRTIADMGNMLKTQCEELAGDYRDYIYAWMAFTKISSNSAALIRRKYMLREKIPAIAIDLDISESSARRQMIDAENELLFCYYEIAEQAQIEKQIS